uniref:Uncharacterized protein n=1 Tax=viral metagenome TaxID=1070528 RepID=A0A6C0KZ10_9ZZZZ
MRTTDVIAILAFIVVGLTAINFLTATRTEGFESGRLSPDVVEQDPAHLLKSEIEMTRPFNVIGTLTQQKCYEQDGHTVIEKVGDYSQRTNNYMRTYPDSCSAPFKELVGSFYAPREGSIGAPIPFGARLPPSTQCA